jgi:4-carboxymuconolactone decarboxylase
VSFGRRGKQCVAWLAGVAAGNPDVLAAAQGPAARNIEASGLDARSHALVRLAASVAAGDCGQPATACEQHVTTALDCGVTLDEIVGIFVALLPTVGTARVVAAAPAVLGALSRATADLPASGAGIGRRLRPAWRRARWKREIQISSSSLARRTASPR